MQTKMLQALIDGQKAMENRLNERFDKVEKEILKNREKIDTVEKNLTERIDIIGISVARLEDDAPTRGEHENLERRVTKIEKQISSN